MGVSRRRILQFGGGAAVLAAAVPAGQHVAWNLRDFTREGYPPEIPPTPDGETLWKNWAGNQWSTPRALAVPKSEEELADLLKRADLPIRPVGSSHSWTALASTEGTIVDLGRFAGLIDHDTESRTATLWAGTRLRHAARLLNEVGLAFPNLPDIDVQTLAGSFSTGTHGTGQALSAMHHYVEGFRLATPSGEIIDVTREGQPELFAAGKVSLGALGIITRYRLKLDRSFKLRRRVWLERVGSLLERAEELAAAHRNFEIYVFPNTGFAAGIAHDLHDGPPTERPPSEDEQLLSDLKGLRDIFGWWPWLRRKVFEGTVPEGMVEDTVDESWKLLSTSRRTKFMEMEYHLPQEVGFPVLRELIGRLDRRREFFFPVEIRFTAPDDAWLSPFNDGPRMSLAVHVPVEESHALFAEELEPIYRRHGGRPHWGKLHYLKGEDLRTLYPELDAFNEMRAALDPEGRMLNDHLRTTLGVSSDA